jgi:ABC-type glycerol-3-phosphate transport system permease component
MALADLRPRLASRPARGGAGLTRMERADRRFAFGMILPTVIAVLAIMGYPWLYSFWLSMNNVNLLTRRWSFIWLNNYAKVIPSQVFLDSFVRTMWFSGLVVVGGTVLGLLMAVVLNESFKGRGLMRSVMLMPWAVAPVVVGKLFALIYSGEYGVLNGLLLQLGLIDNYVPLLAEARRALVLVAVASIWQAAPLSGLLLLAGLQSIPGNLYNAAKIDGASATQRFRKITLPWLRPMLLLVIILNTINAVMTFDLIYVLTQGGPGESTTVLSWLGYVTFFNFARYGEGTAILYVLSLISVVLAIVYFRILARREPTRRGTDAVPVVAPRTASTASLRALRTELAMPKPRVRTALLPPRTAKRLTRVGLYTAVLGIAVWSLAPFYILLNASLSSAQAILSHPPSWFPSPPTFENYRAVLFGEEVKSETVGGGVQARAILLSMRNSAVVAVSVTLINILIGAPAGYAFARFPRFRFTGVALWTLMITRMIPPLTLAVPFFMLFRRWGLIDTIPGLIIAFSSIILPLTVWIMKGYFETLPATMERAALVDGATRFQSFRRIVVPIAVPGLVAAAIFCFLVAWNEFVYAILLTSSLDSQTLPTRIAQFVSDQRIYNPGLLFAAGVFAIIPPVAITLLFQRYLLRGMLAGAVKG